MPYVECTIDVTAPAATVYALAKEQERFPDFMPDVETVVVLERHPDHVITRWKTLVEDAPIEWTENDRFDDERLRIDYALIEGDLDTFEGAWTFEQHGDVTRVVLSRRVRFRRADPRGADRPDAGKESARELRHDARRAQSRGGITDGPAVGARYALKLVAVDAARSGIAACSSSIVRSSSSA